MTAMDEPTERQERLAALEKFAEETRQRVDADLAAFLRSIASIHEERLWEDDYRSWNDYLLRRWEVSKATGWRWLKQADALLELESAEERGTSSGTAALPSPPRPPKVPSQRETLRARAGKQPAKAARPPKAHEPDVFDPPETGQLSWSFEEPESVEQFGVVLRWVRNVEPGKIAKALTPAEVRQGLSKWKAAVALLAEPEASSSDDCDHVWVNKGWGMVCSTCGTIKR